MHAGAIHLNTVFVAPLLALLPDAVAHHNHTVVAHTADHRFGNAAAGGDFTYARFRRYGTDDIAACTGGQLRRAHHRYGRAHFLHFCVTGQARNYYLFELQMLIEHIRGILTVFLCSCRPPQEQHCQKQSMLFPTHPRRVVSGPNPANRKAPGSGRNSNRPACGHTAPRPSEYRT